MSGDKSPPAPVLAEQGQGNTGCAPKTGPVPRFVNAIDLHQTAFACDQQYTVTKTVTETQEGQRVKGGQNRGKGNRKRDELIREAFAANKTCAQIADDPAIFGTIDLKDTEAQAKRRKIVYRVTGP